METGPTTEVGAAAPNQGLPTLASWTSLIDDREWATELTWPNSVTVYARMETDAQTKGLCIGTMLPIRRMLWQLDPQDADPEALEAFSEDTGLPIVGRKAERQLRRVRRRNRFNHDRHLAHALRALTLGHYPFEQVGELDEQERWRLRKLATRPPRTIAEIQVERDGELRGIKQNGAWNAPVIPASRLVYYVWDPQDDADWLGRSMFRSIYKNWLVKDKLVRVDVTKHERNGMGVPWFDVDPAATDDQIKELAATAERWRSGETAGGAGPGRPRLVGVEGSVPDTIASARWHDQQMARAFVMLFAELGQSETGSRALGDSLIDWYVQSQDAIADWYAETFTEHVIEDWFDWNYGEEAPAPRLVWKRNEDAELAAADMARLVDAGVIEVDEELEDAVREAAKLPKRSSPRAPKPVPPAVPPPGTEPDDGEPDAQAHRETTRRVLRERILGEVAREPRAWVDLAAAVGRDRRDGTARRARDELIAEGRIVKRDGVLAQGTKFRRELFEHEVEAAVDFEALQMHLADSTEALVAAVKGAQVEQFDQVEATIADADGDLSNLAQLRVDPIDAEVIADALEDAAAEGVRQATEEAKAQGVKAVRAAAPDPEDVNEVLRERAEAIAMLLAGSLGDVSARQAVQRTGGALTASEVAREVRSYLEGLTDTYLRDELGGAVTQATNTGRKAVMRANEPTSVYSSELLDENTCPPCEEEDGTNYPSVEAAEKAYPTGGYVNCKGGLRCRGTLVAVYG